MKPYRVLAQPTSGENEKREYVVEANDEDEAKKLALAKMIERESEGALLDSPAQIFTTEEINPEPKKISDLIDNLDYYVGEMRKTNDADAIPAHLKQYALDYFRDVKLDDEALRALALFTMDKTYRVASYLEIVDIYTKAYFAKVIPHIWDYLHHRGLSIFYIVDNSFGKDGRFEAVTELLTFTGIAVVAPYSDQEVLPYEKVERKIKERMEAGTIIVYIEKDDSVDYLKQVMELATHSSYYCIFRNKASANPSVEVLNNHS